MTKKVENSNNTETLSLNVAGVRRNCSFCQFFQHEEIGDSDFGAVYAKNASCTKYLDIDKETEEDIPNFDRELVRDCCVLDFWKIEDAEIDNLISEDDGNIDRAYKLFNERYNYA